MGKVLTKILAVAAIVALLPALAGAAGDAEKGKAVYDEHCASCHGPGGKGDGPGAAALDPKPRDFTDKAYMSKLTDQYMVDIVTKGGAAFGKSPLLVPFGGKLSPDDIQNVVAYVRTLSK